MKRNKINNRYRISTEVIRHRKRIQDLLQKDESDMTIEEIMLVTGVNKITATTIYEAERGINLCEPVEGQEYLARFRRMREMINKRIEKNKEWKRKKRNKRFIFDKDIRNICIQIK